MKVVILCGGQGTRLREETEFKPKPLVEIGKLPILVHIMKIFSKFGHNDFILALGYKGYLIKEYFLHYKLHTSDFTLNTKEHDIIYHNNKNDFNWNITFADTGLETLTAKRLFKLKKYLKNDDLFLLTYGDGIADIDINKLIEFHKSQGKIVTITGINPPSPFGIINMDEHNIVKNFKEKPISNYIINGGFMVLSKKIFNYINKDEDVMLVGKTIPEIAKKGEVIIYHHKGFWHSMDTYRDYLKLNEMYKNNEIPWIKNV